MEKTTVNSSKRVIGEVIIFAVALAFIGSATYAQSRPAVKISPETSIERERITLGDIAQIFGTSESSEKLRNIPLGYAPAVGMTRELNRGQIMLAVRAAGFAESDFVLQTPPKMFVRRAGQTVTQEQVRLVVEKAVADRFAAGNVSTNIVRIDLPPAFEIATGKAEIKANISSVLNPFERFSLPVEIRVDGRIVRTFAVNVEIEAFADVFVAARDLVPNTRIAGGDVSLERQKLTKPLNAYLRNSEDLRGMKTLKFIAAGDAITSDSFAGDVVVRSGDKVKVEAVSGRLKIVLSGEARGPGRIGDRIAVKNLQSGMMLQAIVLDEGSVKIAF